VAKAFIDARIATMVTRSTGFVVAKGITAAYNAAPHIRSDYVNWTTYSIVLLSLDLARNAAEPYMGAQSSPEILNAMQNDIDQAMHFLIQLGAASSITANIIQTRDQQILGELDVDINMVPYGEISNINFRHSLSR
jgi:hypothetical protein